MKHTHLFTEQARERVILQLLLLIAIGGFVAMSFNACKKEEPLRVHKKIFVIQSDERSCKDYIGAEKEIADDFRRQGIEPEMHTVYLGCEFLFNTAEVKQMKAFVDTAQRWKPDVIIVFGDQATFSLMKTDLPYVHQVPILFAGVNYPNWPLLKSFPNIKGYWDKPDILGTIKMVKDLHGMRDICFWQNESRLGKMALYYTFKELQRAGIRLSYQDYHFLPGEIPYVTQTMKQRDDEFYTNIAMKDKAPDSMMYNSLGTGTNSTDNLFMRLTYPRKFKTLIQISRTFTSRSLGLHLDTEAFTVLNRGFGGGEGFVGGHITTRTTERRLTVKSASDILKGNVKIDTMGYYVPPKSYVIDWQAAKQWNIQRNKIPKYCTVINDSIYDRYRMAFNILHILLIVAVIAVILLIVRKERIMRLFAQKNLKRSEKFLSMAYASGKIYPYESDGYIYKFDPSFYKVNGLPDEPVTRETFSSWVHPDGKKAYNDHMDDLMRDHGSESMISQRLFSFHGEPYSWWELRYSYSAEEKMFYGTCLNINDVKEKEQQLIQAQHKAEESDRMKSVFLANMSHEIRTPLNAIVGFSNLITEQHKELPEEDMQQYCSLINTNCSLLLKLISDILDLSRMESNKMNFNYMPQDLNDLFRKIYKTERQLVPSQLELRLQVPETTSIVRTDPLRFTQLMTNLINNASKFTEKGYIAFRYALVDDGKTIECFVEDTGRGISKEGQKIIFDRFSKLDSFSQGAGLGLSICQGIIKQFGGTISIQSEVGKGSRFTIRLPFVVPEEETDNKQ